MQHKEKTGVPAAVFVADAVNEKLDKINAETEKK